MTDVVCTGRGPSGSQALHEETVGCPISMLSANSSMPAFPCTSLCNAAHVTGVEQTGLSLQCGTQVCPGFHFCVKLSVVWVCSGMNLCFAIFLSVFIFLSILGSCLVFNISITQWFPLEILCHQLCTAYARAHMAFPSLAQK